MNLTELNQWVFPTEKLSEITKISEKIIRKKRSCSKSITSL